MSGTNNGGAGAFGFGKPNGDSNKPTETAQTNTSTDGADVTTSAPTTRSRQAEIDESLNSEYTDIRTISVKLVKNFSLYRRANDKSLPKRSDHIGSSVSSSITLSSNKDEIETYFPNIIGLSPNNPDFVARVKQYLNNIRIMVDELGKTFNASFIYKRKADYLKIVEQEEAIEAEYRKVDRNNLKALKEAAKLRITKLNILESSKCLLGRPVEVEEYLMYRHCLLYKDIAKDIAFINSDPSIRFYFEDEQREQEKKRKFRLEVNKAKANYVSCLADDKRFEAVYIQYCIATNTPVIRGLHEDQMNKEIKLDRFSTEEPVKFNKFFENKDLELSATIELLIARGELVRSDYNQQITTVDGDFIGANMTEALSYFKHPDNTSILNSYKGRLNNV